VKKLDVAGGKCKLLKNTAFAAWKGDQGGLEHLDHLLLAFPKTRFVDEEIEVFN
jgi:hypothetical protein